MFEANLKKLKMELDRVIGSSALLVSIDNTY
ncbi:hypothetical protein [Desulfallas thermosapovorans]